HDMYLSIETVFAQHGIQIPYPQRVLHTAVPGRPATTGRDRSAPTEGPRQYNPLNMPDPE
ncbi:MAG: hypothetical protein ACRES4_03550, partial [Nevskiales bacterium]